MGLGLLCVFIIPADPQHTRLLTEEERALALARIDAEQAVKTQGLKERTTLKLILKSFNINVIFSSSDGIELLSPFP